jgi:hypothetical protein
MMDIHTIVLALFTLTLFANAVALVRHWRMMQVMAIVLNNFSETQEQYNQIIEMELQKQADQKT